MTNLKIERLGRSLMDDLIVRFKSVTNPTPVVASHDASGDLYLTVTDAPGSSAVVKFEAEALQASGQYDSLGLGATVYTPHITKLGLDAGSAGVAASGTATLGAALTAGDVVTIGGVAFTSIDTGATGNQWNITGTKAAGTATIGADLVAGDKVTINGHDFTSIDSGAAGDQWNITGVQATGTVQCVGVVATDAVVINGVTLTADAAIQDATHFVVGGTDIITATNLVTCIAANAGLAAIVTAANAGGTVDTVTLTAVRKGTVGNAYTLADGGSTHFTVSGPTMAGGSVNRGTCALALATAIAASVTAGITGVVTAAQDGTTVEQVNLSGVNKGTSGNVTLTQTGGHITVSGATLTGGAIDLNATATTLAAVITASTTAGIQNVVDARAAAAVVTVYADSVGAGGNTVTLTQTGGHITVSGATLSGGTNATPAGTSNALRYALIAECAPTGTALLIYEKAGIAVTDLTNVAYLVATIRNLPFGLLAQV